MSDARVALSVAIQKSSGCSFFTAAEEAAAIVGALADDGWYLTRAEPLPTAAPSRRDPDTSVAAAASLNNLAARHWSVYVALMELGPATDEELVDRYPTMTAARGPIDFPPHSPQSIRTRRSELVRAGHVEWTTLLRPVRSGRQARVWQAVTR